MTRADPTLRTIAEELGIHYSTVSRVLNGSADDAAKAASEATRARIRAAADRIGYVPSPLARALRTNRSGLIGVLVPQLQDYVVATIYGGIQAGAAEFGYHALVTNTLDDPETHDRELSTLIGRKVDGVVLCDSRVDSTFTTLRERGIPFVLVNRPHADAVSATVDDYVGGRLAGEHLLEIGRTAVGVLTGPTYARTALDRAQGLLDVFSEAGLAVPAENVLYRTFDAPGGRNAARELLSRSGASFDALFVTNDFAAIGAMGALREAGLRIPEDVALIGFNDISLARDLPIPLTTIRSPSHQMGVEGARLLFDLIEGRPAESILLPPQLVRRETTRVAVPRP
jgi:LacI family transcriptional regulator